MPQLAHQQKPRPYLLFKTITILNDTLRKARRKSLMVAVIKASVKVSETERRKQILVICRYSQPEKEAYQGEGK